MKFSISIGIVGAIIFFGFFACDDPEHTNPTDPNYEPSPPTKLTVNPHTDTSMVLGWQDNEKYELGFRVERDAGLGFLEIATVGADTTEFIDIGLTYRESYSYRVATYTAATTSDYSSVVTTAACMNCVVDYDGNVYETIQIGNQVWMAENLKVTHYRDGTEISTEADWGHTSTGAFIINDNAGIDGVFYNWYVVDDSRIVAPEGWHVPSDAEWKELEIALGMNQSEADETGFRGTNEGSVLAGEAELWNNGTLINNSGFDSSGFTALPVGYYLYIYRNFVDEGTDAYFWTASQGGDVHAWCRSLNYTKSKMKRNVDTFNYGFSIRCVKD
jgi:uncharacterized protein (TIGR02145 family)